MGIIALLLVIVVVGGGGGYVWLSTSLPVVSGTLRLPGLKAEAVVARDDLGVPQITAQSSDDAMFALGFVHAQDRLWQMELQRRVGAGRLAELIGTEALPIDRFMRTLGLYRLAEASIDHLNDSTKHALDAYAAGVNAYITAHRGALPPEFVLLRTSPEPWKPADSLVWGRLMGLQLSSNWRDELLRARVAAAVPPEMVADLWTAEPKDGAVTLGMNGGDAPSVRHAENPVGAGPAAGPALLATMARLIAAIPPEAMPRLDSNQWVVAGAHTASGKPILSNDPHLELNVPVVWYLASIKAPDLDVTGVTAPGVPAVVLGHNNRIAWGMTTTTSDTMDLFIEKTDGDGYVTPDGTKPFGTRDEVINVRGGAPVTLKVRTTRHGPIVTDILGEDAGGQILSLSASFLQPDDITAQAIMEVDRAQNWDDFVSALKDFGSPEQNISYADVDGHIGLMAPGRVPIRKSGDGSVPHPGWTGEFDWTGWIPFDELPKSFDPPSGSIVNANNRLEPDSYNHFLTSYWPEDYRARRIETLLAGRSGLVPSDMAAIQLDEVSLAAVELKPLLLRTPPVGPQATAAHSMLESWDGAADLRKPQPLIFNSWMEHLQRDLLVPWIGTAAGAFTDPRPRFLKAVLSGRTKWCAPPGKTSPDNCDAIVAQALGETLADLSKKYGTNMAEWRWGEAHKASFDALLFGRIPFLDRLTRLEAPSGGDDFTVRRGQYVSSEMVVFPNRDGPGMRAIYDLKDLGSSRFVLSTGQSGNPFSEHWGDMFDRWLAGASFALDSSRSRPDVLHLMPSQ
jgi:penicillin amidase